LSTEQILGKYFNLMCPKIVGELKASIDDNISDLMTTNTIKNKEGLVTEMSLLMRRNIYEKLKTRKTAGMHEGFRHIELLDANNLMFHNKSSYGQIKFLEYQLK